MPTDFSFVTDEGWDALKPQFDRAEQKLKDKVRRREITEDQAQKLTKLMWEKYDHWVAGKGMKEKENQMVFQQKPIKKASIQHEARIGRTQLVQILNAVADGTVQNPAVFQQTLEANKITEQEFFSFMAQDVSRYPQLYPKQLIGFYNEHFSDWGYEAEMRQVVDQSRGAVGPKPPSSYDRPEQPRPETQVPPVATAPSPAAPPQAKPAPVPDKMTVDDVAPQPEQFKVEPQPWPQQVPAPKPSARGQVYRWYLIFVLKGEQAPRAAVVDGISRQDMLDFIHVTERGGAMKFRVARPVTETADQAPAAGPASAPQAQKPVPPPPPQQSKEPPSESPVGQIDAPDSKDPAVYRWYLKYRLNSGHETAVSPDNTGAQMEAMLRRLEQMGIKVLELKKMNIAPTASIVVDESDIRLAADGAPQEKFRNGTPIIFTEDVNLEFDALSARGKIKKNMTGKIKKVEDNDYLIDIAGQLYRVPRLVAEHVMDVFAANVVTDTDLDQPEQTPGQKQSQPPAQPGQEAQAPAAQPQGQAPGQNGGQIPPGGAPQMPAGMASADGRIVVADFEVEAATNSGIAEAFAQGATRGKGNNMFIDGDTIYSYGRHFPMATRGADGTIYMTTKKYSVSTAKHLSYLRQALAQSGLNVVLSDTFIDGKVAVPSPEEIARHEHEAAEAKVKERKRDERRELKRQKQVEQSRVTSPEQGQDMVELEQPDDRGVPLKNRVDRTLAPQNVEDLESMPSLSSEQWQARIQDMEDQLLRESDPERQEKMRQRLERMKQASWSQTMTRLASGDDAFQNSLLDVSDLHEHVKKMDKNQVKLEKKDQKNDLKLENKRPQTASIQNKAFSELLLLIEQGGPGVPSDMGKRLYRADGAVSRASA